MTISSGGPVPTPSVSSLGPAPTSRSPVPGLTAWHPPASRAYLPPTTSAPTPGAEVRSAKIPSLARRLTFGGLRMLPLVVVYVALPLLGFQALEMHGLVEGLPIAQVVLLGLALAFLSTAAYVARPTRAFGPFSTASSAGKVLYLVYFAGFAWASVSVASASVRLDFGNLLLLLAVVPAFGIAAGILTTVQDARHPGERLPFDYPP